MSFLVDTDICSAFLKSHPLAVKRFLQYTGGLNISTVILGELYTWALRAKAPQLVGQAACLSPIAPSIQSCPLLFDGPGPGGNGQASCLSYDAIPQPDPTPRMFGTIKGTLLYIAPDFDTIPDGFENCLCKRKKTHVHIES